MRESLPFSQAPPHDTAALPWIQERTLAVLDAWWKPKATNLFVVLYAVTLLTALPPGRLFAVLLPAALTILGIGAFGHLVNDWFDRRTDAAVGKPNRLAGLPRTQASLLLLAALATALVPWLLLPADALSAALLLLEFALLLAYAVPPIRLKLRRVWPIAADAAYAYAVPAALAAHTFFLAAGRPDDGVFLLALCVWQLALGTRHFLNHLALDRRNDAATHTPTLATKKGNRFIHRFIRRVVSPIELAGVVAVLLVLGRGRVWLPSIVAALVLIWAAVHIVLTVGRRYPLAAYRFSAASIDRLYQDVLPLILLAFLTAADWRFILLVPIHVVLFSTGVPFLAAGAMVAWSVIAGRTAGMRRVQPPAPPDAAHASAAACDRQHQQVQVHGNVRARRDREAAVPRVLPARR